MQRPIIGIVSRTKGWNDSLVFTDRYYVLDNYTQAIVRNGGVPIALVMSDLKLVKESLSLCDGFLCPGGNEIHDYDLEIIDYALKNNKPYLGICMGMQALAMYSFNQNKEKNIIEKIATPHFHDDKVTKESKEKTCHSVTILKKDSHLYNIFKKDTLKVNSFHNYQVKKLGNDFEIVGKSEDGTFEIIEHVDKSKFIVGVQWHPELLSSMDPLIKKFIEISGKNNEN